MATVALYVGWAITVTLAIGGWLASQAQARRAKRRDMRIDYLLDAYRRLDRAANRPLTQATAQDIEAAVSDTMLLGTPSQASLASQFVRTFNADGAAEAMPLLMDLRASLRNELRLGQLPPTYSSLRVTVHPDAATDHARIWREQSQITRKSVDAEIASQEIPPDYAAAFPAAMAELAETASPSAAIAASYQRVELALRQLLAGTTTEDFSALNTAQLANRALELKLIDPHLADTLNGLSVMRLLAVMDQDRTSLSNAKEFIGLAAAVLYLLKIASRRT